MTLTAIVSIALASCHHDKRAIASDEYIESIEQIADKDAQRIIDAPNIKERERILLDIRAKEYALRSQNFSNSADIYITRIRAILDSVDLDEE